MRVFCGLARKSKGFRNFYWLWHRFRSPLRRVSPNRRGGTKAQLVRRKNDAERILVVRSQLSKRWGYFCFWFSYWLLDVCWRLPWLGVGGGSSPDIRRRLSVRKPPLLRNNNGSLDVIVRNDGRDAFMSRLGR